eukprot:SAG31_NODE_25128_length_467_cov_1.078804_2_plen_76_part_01
MPTSGLKSVRQNLVDLMISCSQQGWLLLRPLSALLQRLPGSSGQLAWAMSSGRLPAVAGGHRLRWALLRPGDSIFI